MSDFAKALIYKLIVDVPVLMLMSWAWFGHPGRNLWYVGSSITVGTVLLYLFEKYWAIRHLLKVAVPVAVFWLAVVMIAFGLLWTHPDVHNEPWH
jgi:hypothetical protein